jgi:predicted nucleotidyltransferase component of viral defense system
MQNYMMERFLERISLSEYKDIFILKGGFLISAIVGLNTRTTMDMDTTIKDYPLNPESLNIIFNKIRTIDIADDISFEILRIIDIREGDLYPGYRIHLSAKYIPLNVPLTVDVTTGDIITPREIEYSYRLMFDDRSISVLAYNLETILAEKLETVLSRNIANTRPRDFYDIHILYALRASECNLSILHQALINTTEKRGSSYIIIDYKEIIESIRNNAQMLSFWEKYRKEFNYAKYIKFDDTCNSVLEIMEHLQKI